MKKLINSILSSLGYKIIRVDSANYLGIHLERSELLEVKKILRSFSQNYSGSENFTYSALKQYLSKERIRFFHQLIAFCERQKINFNDKKIVDVGCGLGYLLRLVHNKSNGSYLFGYDTYEEILPLAQAFCPSATFETRGIYDLEQSFDLIFCTEVVEHLIEPHEAVKRLYESLNPGGALVITIPDGRYDTFPALQMRTDETAYWGHVHYWSPESWPLYLNRELPQAETIKTGKINATKMYAIITPSK